MPENFAGELNQDVRTQMVDLLNKNLVNMLALTLAVKQAHWNLKGPGFIGVHELLDEAADRLREGADLIAERAVIGWFRPRHRRGRRRQGRDGRLSGGSD